MSPRHTPDVLCIWKWTCRFHSVHWPYTFDRKQCQNLVVVLEKNNEKFTESFFEGDLGQCSVVVVVVSHHSSKIRGLCLMRNVLLHFWNTKNPHVVLFGFFPFSPKVTGTISSKHKTFYYWRVLAVSLPFSLSSKNLITHLLTVSGTIFDFQKFCNNTTTTTLKLKSKVDLQIY